MANSWKFMLKKNQLTCFIFGINGQSHKTYNENFIFYSYILGILSNL